MENLYTEDSCSYCDKGVKARYVPMRTDTNQSNHHPENINCAAPICGKCFDEKLRQMWKDIGGVVEY